MTFVNILNYILTGVIITFHYIGLLIVTIFDYLQLLYFWLKEYNYNNPDLYLGFTIYIYFVYRMFFRTSLIGPINEIPISTILITIYFLITLAFFLRMVYNLYKLYKKTTTENFNLRFTQIASFYTEILNTTFLTLLYSLRWIHKMAVFLNPYCDKYLVSIKFILSLLFLRYGIPMFLSFCFALDIFILHQFVYFPFFVILYIIPLLIRIIIYILKTTSYEERNMFAKNFDITIKGIIVTEFALKREFHMELNQTQKEKFEKGE